MYTIILRVYYHQGACYTMPGQSKRRHFVLPQVLLWEVKPLTMVGLSVGDLTTERESLTERGQHMVCGTINMGD